MLYNYRSALLSPEVAGVMIEECTTTPYYYYNNILLTTTTFYQHNYTSNTITVTSTTIPITNMLLFLP